MAAAAATPPGSAGPGAGGAAAEDDDGDCVICFESLDARGGAVPLPCECRVQYCHHCWDRALAASMSACGRALCPSCRTSMHVDFDAGSGRLIFSREPGASSSGSGGGGGFFDDFQEENEEHWRQRLYQQAKPLQIALLQQYGAQESARAAAAEAARAEARAAREAARAEAGEGEESDSSSGVRTRPLANIPDAEAPRCVCGSRLNCTSARERVLAFVAEAPMPTPPSLIENLMMRPPIVCDICGRQVEPRSRVWTCENGRRTVLHAVRYDVCEACFAFYAFGVEVPSDGEDDEESEEPFGYETSTSDEDKDDW